MVTTRSAGQFSFIVISFKAYSTDIASTIAPTLGFLASASSIMTT
jgi:hypothetical protein